MSLKGKDNQAASEDVLKLAPQVLYIFSQHIYLVTLPKNDLLSHLNWGAQVLMEISSNV